MRILQELAPRCRMIIYTGDTASCEELQRRDAAHDLVRVAPDACDATRGQRGGVRAAAYGLGFVTAHRLAWLAKKGSMRGG